MSVSPVSDSKIYTENKAPSDTKKTTCLQRMPDSVKWIFTSRWALAFISFFGFVLVYALRVNMSVAVVCMVNNTALQEHNAHNQTTVYDTILSSNMSSTPTGDICEASAKNSTNDGEFVWSKGTQGLILSSFFYGYLVTQIPGGWLAQRFGGKRVIGYCMVFPIASTLLSPIGARASPYLLLALRVINGLGQGVFYPSMHVIWSKWAPPLERSKLIAFTYAGGQMGNVLTFPISAVLCEYGFDGGWSSIFYVIGICGFVWLVLWMLIVSDSPDQHPRISADERDMIVSTIGVKKSQTEHTTPWLSIVKSPAVWAIIVVHTCANWGTYTLLTNIPTYMKEILKFNIQSSGIFSAIPYICYWALINISGLIADYMRARGIRTKIVRKIMILFGMLGPGTLLIVTGYMNCQSPYAAVAVLSLAVGFCGFQYPGYMVNHVDIAPPFAGVLFGISNTVATIPGIIAPYAVGVLTNDSTQAEWRVVFYLSAAIYLFGAIVYCILGDGEVQPWVRPYMVQEVTEEQTNTDFKSTPSSRNVLEEDEKKEASPS